MKRDMLICRRTNSKDVACSEDRDGLHSCKSERNSFLPGLLNCTKQVGPPVGASSTPNEYNLGSISMSPRSSGECCVSLGGRNTRSCRDLCVGKIGC